MNQPGVREVDFELDARVLLCDHRVSDVAGDEHLNREAEERVRNRHSLFIGNRRYQEIAAESVEQIFEGYPRRALHDEVVWLREFSGVLPARQNVLPRAATSAVHALRFLARFICWQGAKRSGWFREGHGTFFFRLLPAVQSSDLQCTDMKVRNYTKDNAGLLLHTMVLFWCDNIVHCDRQRLY